MGFYKNLYSLCNLASKITNNSLKNSTPNSISLRNFTKTIRDSEQLKTQFKDGLNGFSSAQATLWRRSSNGFAISSLVRSNWSVTGSQRSGFLSNKMSMRFYHVDRYQVRHFRPRGPRRWFQNPRVVLVVFLVGSGAVITVYLGNVETIPYTHRKHFVILSHEFERKLGEKEFENLKASLKKKILPAIHPDSVRVRLIAKDIIDALRRGIRQEQAWSDLQYSDQRLGMHDSHGSEETLAAVISDKEDLKDKVGYEDEILDDKWVEKSRKAGQARGSHPTTSHLDSFNWEVIVVDDPMVNAFCLPGGKIVVFTGLLRHFRSDAEIATVLGHEVGHAVARHVVEMITKNMWLVILQLVLLQFIWMPDLVSTMSHLLLRLPFSRSMEIEADHIGLLLLASAGYDPRVAPTVYEKLGQLHGESALRDYLSTHPSGKKRAELLRQAQVMEEALRIYQDVITGRGVEGFL